jgi:nucleoside-diphosphate-sugar epimerase
MKVLFIGGTGVISAACSKRAIERGIDLHLLNRGKRRVPIDAAKLIHADIRDPDAVRAALGDSVFDVIVDWIAFAGAHIRTDLALFGDRCRQYVFISSASAYHKPIAAWPITESTPLHNPWWEYSRRKIECEQMLMHAYREDGFPVTIVRPSHTYGPTGLPTALADGPTLVRRMRENRPVVVHGDGTSLWTVTWNEDFADAFVALLGRDAAIGQAFHITGDQWLTWDQMHRIIGRALGVEPNIVHMPSDFVAKVLPERGPGLLGDKAHCAIFDNTKIKRLVPGWSARTPFEVGAQRCIDWLDADPARCAVNERAEAEFQRLLDAWADRR